MRCIRRWSLLVACTAPLGCGPTGGGDDDGTDSGPAPTSTDSETSEPTATGSSPSSTEDGTVDGTGSADTTTSADSTSSGGSIDCEAIDPNECSGVKECTYVRATEALPRENPGEYSCSDLSMPFACLPLDCKPFAGIVCDIGDPSNARWIREGCVPPGWEPCPDAICV